MSIEVDPRQARSTHIVLNAMGIDPGVLNNDDPDFHRAKIDEWLAGHGIGIAQYPYPCDGANIVEYLDKARAMTGFDRIHQFFLAYRKAEALYYGLWTKVKGHKTPMPEEVKELLAEHKEALRLAEGKPPPHPRKPTKGPRLPLWQDREAQIAKEKQYPWIKPHSWAKDPEKAGSTTLEIICQDCGDERTIHAADAFQVKRCKECKKKRPSKAATNSVQ